MEPATKDREQASPVRMALAGFGRHVPWLILSQLATVNAAALREGMRSMHNQHAGLSQALAEQRISERHEQADHARLVRGARPPRRHRWRLGRGWWQWARWPGVATDQPAGRPHRAS
jgi:hypothetical protein